MGSINLDITRFEVTGVYTHPDARADIVLVHGLNGDPEKTWTAKNGVFWPAGLLPETLKDHHANILVYGYNADVYSRGHGKSASDNFIFQHAQTLVSHLTAYRKRERTTRNPIIWVAHSLGGILVKRALLYSNDVHAADHEPLRAIFVSTYGIIFLGTPHDGSGLATWGRLIQAMSDAIVPKKLFESESVLLKTLKRDNERLQEINNHFLDIYQRFHIQMAHENHKSDLKGTKAFIVTSDSAGPPLPGVSYYGIEADHSGMCKFSGPSAPGYRTVSTAISDWVEEAPACIEVRWQVEDKERRDRALYDIDERSRPFTSKPRVGDATHSDEHDNKSSPQPLLAPPAESTITVATGPENTLASPVPPPAIVPTQAPTLGAPTSMYEPLFLHPEPFRPNSYFVGRQKELEELHMKLTDKKKRAEGTSAVLIQCLPGGGKTHLARQYVFEHRADYPGGIYWVRSKSITEMEQFYWKIAKSEALHDLVQKGSNSALNGKRNGTDSDKPQNVVDVVRSLFNSFDQWLLIFDGIHFDTPGIRKFIPDAKNTSLIYTSIQHSATGMYEFDNPQIIELGLLDAEDAQNLLLEEMEKKKPWTQDDRSRALELVQLMGQLPLMIHVAAGHLKATCEPLSKYLRTYQARPRVGQLPAYRAVYSELDKRGANAALNLMSILAFYDQWIPVGMFMLGLGALDNITPVRTKDAWHKTKSINNSLKILIAFALIERTESDYVSPTASPQGSSKHSFDRVSGSVDVLRVHSVVQGFFVDLLASKKELNFWLERAAAVFCASFDEADKKVTEDAKLGLPDDFRRFIIHGHKLLEHLTRAEKKSGVPVKLTAVRADVEAKLRLSQDAIDRLSAAAQKHIMAGSVLAERSEGVVLKMSVFERGNSLSESDSATPSSQISLNGSGTSTRTGTGLDGQEDGETAPYSKLGDGKGKGPERGYWILTDGFDNRAVPIYGSPTHYHSLQAHDEQNPYHWHIPYSPYPDEDSTISAPPLREDSDDRTEVATPHVSEGPGGPAFPSRPRTYNSLSGSIVRDWRPPISGHRTVRRKESRRYHDRAGSWRDSTISDPRISVSREIAKGNVFRPETLESETEVLDENGQAGSSGAEMSLYKIKAAILHPFSSGPAAEPSPTASDLAVEAGDAADLKDIQSHQHKSRAQSTGSLVRRPIILLREAGATSTGETLRKGGFASGLSATLKRLKENILPSHASTYGSEGDLRALKSSQESQEALSSSIASLLNRQPSPMFRGSRTAQSSPSQRHGPFRPPPSSDEPPAFIRPWETQVYTSGRSQFDVSDLSFGIAEDDLMAASYPPLPRAGNAYPATTRHPPVAGSSYWRQQPLLRPSLIADGYSSQPMSRGGSTQSQPDADSGHGHGHGSPGVHGAGILMTGGSHSFSSAIDGEAQYSHSLPTSYRPGRLAFPVAIPPTGLRTPASWVETEPSPQTHDAFSEVNTSYQRWEERHTPGYGRRRANPGSLDVAMERPMDRPAWTGRASTNSAIIGAGGGVPMSRSVSGPASGSGSATGSGAVPGSRIAAVRQAGQQRSPSQASAGSPARAAVESGVYTSEPMVRSGSGGIQLSDGRIVPFGQSPRRLPVEVAADMAEVEDVANVADMDTLDCVNGSGLSPMIGLGIVQGE